MIFCQIMDEFTSSAGANSAAYMVNETEQGASAVYISHICNKHILTDDRLTLALLHLLWVKSGLFKVFFNEENKRFWIKRTSESKSMQGEKIQKIRFKLN